MTVYHVRGGTTQLVPRSFEILGHPRHGKFEGENTLSVVSERLDSERGCVCVCVVLCAHSLCDFPLLKTGLCLSCNFSQVGKETQLHIECPRRRCELEVP
ncbi:hypothetical protein M758_4G112000 [Ceratodon purpureus]|nr:hypothetical protein M758_4G112000 [Ceratodon purpureus]